MINYLVIGFGAALGGVFRYWLAGFIHKYFSLNFPYGTLIINILGSFILGIVVFYFDSKTLISNEFKLFLTIGLCGGFTTFSTFSLEVITLIRNSQLVNASIYIVASVILSLLAVIIAYFLSKLLN